jgi:hypothetical protein
MLCKLLHIQLNTERQEPHLKPGVNSGAPEGQAISVPLVEPVVLLFLQTRWHVMNEERPDSDNDKRNSSVVICDRDIP